MSDSSLFRWLLAIGPIGHAAGRSDPHTPGVMSRTDAPETLAGIAVSATHGWPTEVHACSCGRSDCQLVSIMDREG